MKKHSLMLALLGSTLVTSSLLAVPAFADQPTCGGTATDNHCIAVLWSKKADVWIEITDGGVTRNVFCHHNLDVDKEEDVHIPEGDPTLRREAFSVCVGGSFAVGNSGSQMINLNPSPGPNSTKNPFNFGKPFVQVGGKVIFLESNGELAKCDDDVVPLFRLDKQDLDGNEATEGDDPLPLGTLVSVITENGANGACLGVRTTFQFRVGTCKIWKTRKFFNTCGSNKTITQIKEFEQVTADMKAAGGQAGPGGAFTAVGQEDEEDQFITLMTGNTGANPGNAKTPFFQRSAAGSVSGHDAFEAEFCACRLLLDPNDEDAFTTAQVERNDKSWLELFLSFFPGGVTLKPKGKAGSEKIIMFHIDVE